MVNIHFQSASAAAMSRFLDSKRKENVGKVPK
jgi:hypothetical protein